MERSNMNNCKGVELFNNDSRRIINKKYLLMTILILFLISGLCIHLYSLTAKVEQLNIRNNKLETRVNDYKKKADGYYTQIKDLTEIVESKTN